MSVEIRTWVGATPEVANLAAMKFFDERKIGGDRIRSVSAYCVPSAGASAIHVVTLCWSSDVDEER